MAGASEILTTSCRTNVFVSQVYFRVEFDILHCVGKVGGEWGERANSLRFAPRRSTVTRRGEGIKGNGNRRDSDT